LGHAEDEETWSDVFEMLKSVDPCILGRVMYPLYEQYWMAVLANPARPAALEWQTRNEKGNQDSSILNEIKFQNW
jgi:hypothetical protein